MDPPLAECVRILTLARLGLNIFSKNKMPHLGEKDGEPPKPHPPPNRNLRPYRHRMEFHKNFLEALQRGTLHRPTKILRLLQLSTFLKLIKSRL